jgi:hypothetical protein
MPRNSQGPVHVRNSTQRLDECRRTPEQEAAMSAVPEERDALMMLPERLGAQLAPKALEVILAGTP